MLAWLLERAAFSQTAESIKVDRLRNTFGSVLPKLLVFEIASGGQKTLVSGPPSFKGEAKGIEWSLIAYLKAAFLL